MPLEMNPRPFITCAVTGSGSTQDKSPHVPRTPANIAASAIDAAKAQLAPVIPQLLQLQVDECLGASGTPQAVIEILNTQSLSPIISLDFLKALAQECCRRDRAT